MRTPRPSRLSALTASAAALLICAPLAAAPSADASATAGDGHKLRATAYQFLLTFDNHETLKTGTLVVDASGHKHGGVILTHGGKLTAKPGIRGRGSQFPHRGRAIIQIANRKSLNPRSRGFVFGAALRLGPTRAASRSNIVQKGYYNQAGGQWKLQLASGGVPVCVIYGDAGRIKAVARHGVGDGRWHRVSCARTSTGVTVWIDGKHAGRVDGLTGRIANDSPVRVGGKKVTAGNKQFRGRLDNVYMRLLPRAS
jgi:concanavalin A-like lectin/glucanase superfamily protein